MAFNYAKEKEKFDNAWKKTEKWYRQEGMSDAAIAEMKSIDWDVFKQSRIAALHETELKIEYVENIEDESEASHSRLWWIEEITDKEVFRCLKSLPKEELLIVTMLLEGYNKTSIAEKLSVPNYYISRQMDKIQLTMSCLLKYRASSVSVCEESV